MVTIYKKYFKRPLDIILSLIALIILSPLMLIIAILVRIKLGSPVIFKQQRPGLNEKIFTMYKFRTMTDEKDENGLLLLDGMRLNKFGKLLRSTSLDELPELWNILKGDMSIVGPRPLLKEYLPYYLDMERRRHDMRPGLTGLSQVKGRSYLNWEERFKLDNNYIENCSFLLDFKIIYTTIFQVLIRKNIANVSEAKRDERGTYIIKDKRIYRRLDMERSGKACIKK